jgi:hypothetical protein
MLLLLVETNPPIQEVISLGCLPRLVQFLGDFSKAMLQVSFLACLSLSPPPPPPTKKPPLYLSLLSATLIMIHVIVV